MQSNVYKYNVTWLFRHLLTYWYYTGQGSGIIHIGVYIASVNWVGIGSGNDLPPVRRQTITWANADLLLTGPLTHFCEIVIEITKALMKMHLEVPSAKWRP